MTIIKDMSARSTGTATISFGMVSIPVKLYTATQPSSGISFHLLHAKDGSRVRQQFVCARDGEVVPRDEVVKGYEFARDRYVVFTPDEIKALEEKATQAIEISEFIPIDKVDPVYFDKPYYLGPDRGGAKAYRLLAETMARTGRVALARWAARGKQYLVLLRPAHGGLVMHQLLYADEVRPFSDVPQQPVEVREQELKLATQLVDQIASDAFHPESYHDDVKQRVLEAVQRKVEGEEIRVTPVEAPGAQVIDLVEALKASLAGPRAERPAASAPAERPSLAERETVERKPARREPRRAKKK